MGANWMKIAYDCIIISSEESHQERNAWSLKKSFLLNRDVSSSYKLKQLSCPHS